MAQVNLESIIDHLSGDVRKAIRDTFDELAPNAGVEASTAYRYFRKRIGRRCGGWQQVNDSDVRS